MYCSFVWKKVKGSLVRRKDLTSTYFIFSFPITRTPSCGYRNTRNSHTPGLMHCKFKFIEIIPGIIRGGQWDGVPRAAGSAAPGLARARSVTGLSEKQNPITCLWLEGCCLWWFCTLMPAGGEQVITDVAWNLLIWSWLVFLFTMFELAGWGQIPSALCDLGKEGRRHVI